MKRRTFIAGLVSAAAWPVMARAQQPERIRRIGVRMSTGADDPEGKVRLAAFLQTMQQLGWTEGRNMHVDVRWGTSDADRDRRYAEELVALKPDVILSAVGLGTQALQRATRAVPIVFAMTLDPVGDGIVESLARPVVIPLVSCSSNTI